MSIVRFTAKSQDYVQDIEIKACKSNKIHDTRYMIQDIRYKFISGTKPIVEI